MTRIDLLITLALGTIMVFGFMNWVSGYWIAALDATVLLSLYNWSLVKELQGIVGVRQEAVEQGPPGALGFWHKTSLPHVWIGAIEGAVTLAAAYGFQLWLSPLSTAGLVMGMLWGGHRLFGVYATPRQGAVFDRRMIWGATRTASISLLGFPFLIASQHTTGFLSATLLLIAFAVSSGSHAWSNRRATANPELASLGVAQFSLEGPLRDQDLSSRDRIVLVPHASSLRELEAELLALKRSIQSPINVTLVLSDALYYRRLELAVPRGMSVAFLRESGIQSAFELEQVLVLPAKKDARKLQFLIHSDGDISKRFLQLLWEMGSQERYGDFIRVMFIQILNDDIRAVRATWQDLKTKIDSHTMLGSQA